MLLEVKDKAEDINRESRPNCNNTIFQASRRRGSEGCGARSTHPVCSKGAQTEDGLCDMSGNV